jgi:hypothetical protein
MRRLAVTLVLLVVPVVPVTAAADVPPAAVAACQAEYTQRGADAFAAKYGPTEVWGHCYAQHMSATTPAATTPDSPAAAACKAEYVRLGPTAFAARYGTPETFGNCVKAHTPTQTTGDNPALAACKADYLKLGADGFVAKYGKDALGQCVKLHTTQTPKQPTTSDASTSVAAAFCQLLAKKLGKDAFVAKYGPREAMGNCVKASLAYAKSLVASCTASSGSSRDAFKACLAAGLQPRRG